MFVARVAGKSMEPMIPDGAWCLFSAPVTGTRQGETVLVMLRDAVLGGHPKPASHGHLKTGQ
jgi:phage repressor protein C with HTH and peptisase S24 domain